MGRGCGTEWRSFLFLAPGSSMLSSLDVHQPPDAEAALTLLYTGTSTSETPAQQPFLSFSGPLARETEVSVSQPQIVQNPGKMGSKWSWTKAGVVISMERL